jgi:hypothetical protein
MDATPEQIGQAVETTGRSLEVETAKALLRPMAHLPKLGEVHLGSYYQDFLSEKMRELDVLYVGRNTGKFGDSEVKCKLHVLLSCKGFPKNRAPIAYTVSSDEIAEYRMPSVLHSIESSVSRSQLGAWAAQRLLTQMGHPVGRSTGARRRIVGFDVVEEEKGKLKPLGDRAIFEGLDSAMKASHWWKRATTPTGYFSNLFVPVLVLSQPWWSVPLDDDPAAPVLEHCGFVSSLYPDDSAEGKASTLFCLVVARELLDRLGNAVTMLLANFPEVTARAFQAGSYIISE